MHLNKAFLKLPIRFCEQTLAEEVRALPASAWDPHPTGFVGNDAVKLVAPGGALTDDFSGEMRSTEHLSRCPYIVRIMGALGGVWGRSRLMGLAPGAEVPAHVDAHYYWRTHLRIHIPIITNPGVSFTCGDETIHMKAGECWVFDSFRWHEVHNRSTEKRIHLVLDTVGGGRLWDLLQAAEREQPVEPLLVEPGQAGTDELAFESVNVPKVMSPWEMRCHVAFLTDQAVRQPVLDQVLSRIDRFIFEWAAAWACFGTHDEGLPKYTELLTTLKRDLTGIRGGQDLQMRNELSFYQVLDQFVLQMALAPPTAPPVQRQPGGVRLAVS